MRKKIIYITSLALFLSLTIPFFVVANDDFPIYEKKLIKSRAKKGYTRGGTAIYAAPVIDEYHDDLTDEERGVFHIDSRSKVRSIHVFPTVKDSIITSKKFLQIGNITIEKNGVVDDVNMLLKIDGNIDAQAVELGGVHIYDSKVKKINIKTDIDGVINAD